ncbi:hypothetical protein DRQ33_05425, partial [bacterium]
MIIEGIIDYINEFECRSKHFISISGHGFPWRIVTKARADAAYGGWWDGDIYDEDCGYGCRSYFVSSEDHDDGDPIEPLGGDGKDYLTNIDNQGYPSIMLNWTCGTGKLSPSNYGEDDPEPFDNRTFAEIFLLSSGNGGVAYSGGSIQDVTLSRYAIVKEFFNSLRDFTNPNFGSIYYDAFSSYSYKQIVFYGDPAMDVWTTDNIRRFTYSFKDANTIKVGLWTGGYPSIPLEDVTVVLMDATATRYTGITDGFGEVTFTEGTFNFDDYTFGRIVISKQNYLPLTIYGMGPTCGWNYDLCTSRLFDVSGDVVLCRDIKAPDSVVINIEPGTHIGLERSINIAVEGTLSINPIPEAPITFEAIPDSGKTTSDYGVYLFSEGQLWSMPITDSLRFVNQICKLIVLDLTTRFQCVSDSAGIDVPSPYIRGVSWLDYNNDGWQDAGICARNRFCIFENNQDETFTAVDYELGLSPLAESFQYPFTGIFGDYDNDGDDDIYICGHYGALFYRNDDTAFVEIMDSAGVRPPASAINNFTASWVDYDCDGYIDLFVGCEYTDDVLFHNNGDGTFTDVTASSGINIGGYTHSTIWGDYDNDGYPDLYMTSSQAIIPHKLFHNNGDGTFTDVTDIALPGPGLYQGHGAVWADFNNDGYLDIYSCSRYGGGDQMLLNNGDGTFTDYTEQSGISAGYGPLSAAVADYDNDGDLDIYVSNYHRGEYNILYNNGDGTFVNVGEEVGVDTTAQTAGISWADYNNDGWMDILVSPDILYKNMGGDNNWLQVKAIGAGLPGKTNTTGIGVRVSVYAGNIYLMQEINGGGNFCSQNGNILGFGLRNRHYADSVIVQWTTGQKTVLYDIEANQRIIIEEAMDTLGPTAIWLSPDTTRWAEDTASIVIQLIDDSEIDQSSILMQVNGVYYDITSPALSFDESTGFLTFTPQPSWNTFRVRCQLLSAEDSRGNPLPDTLTGQFYVKIEPGEAAEEWADSVITILDSLPDDVFDGNANNRRRVMGEKLEDAVEFLSDGNTKAASTLLLVQLLERLDDGCDGSGDNDWVEDGAGADAYQTVYEIFRIILLTPFGEPTSDFEQQLFEIAYTVTDLPCEDFCNEPNDRRLSLCEWMQQADSQIEDEQYNRAANKLENSVLS